jgi:GTP-dependent phosphoenolpyruvate carboxykinase
MRAAAAVALNDGSHAWGGEETKRKKEEQEWNGMKDRRREITEAAATLHSK